MSKQEYPNLKISLLGCSNDPLEVIYTAMSAIQPDTDILRVWRDVKYGAISKQMMEHLIKSHTGPITAKSAGQFQFMFICEHLSSGTAKDLARYQVIRQNLNSNRNDVQQNQNELPFGLKNNRDLANRWKALQAELNQFYDDCKAHGVEANRAQDFLADDVVDRLHLVFSFIELQQFLDQKMCDSAPWEINEMAWQIYEIMKREFPVQARRLGIKCWENRNLFCDESQETYRTCRWCEKRPHKTVVNGIWKTNKFSKETQVTTVI